MDLWTHFWTLYFEGKIRDLKVNIELYTTVLYLISNKISRIFPLEDYEVF